MKKLLIVLLALTVLGIFAFADDAAAPAAKLSVGAWGRGWFSPLVSDGTNQFVAAGPGWGGAGTGNRVGVSFDGSSANFGFDWNPGMEGTTFDPICDQAKLWAQISPMLKIEIGKVQGDALRGKLDDTGDFLAVTRGYAMPGKDAVFQRFYPGEGLLLDITPVDGLYIGAALDSKGFYETSALATSLSNAYQAIQVGAGYTIANVGQVRAQYIGNATAKLAKVQAAFAYTGMAGLTADVGYTYVNDSNAQMTLVAGAYFNAGPLSSYARVDTHFGGASALKFNATADGYAYYTVADPLSVGVEALFTGMAASGSDAKVLDLFPAIKLAYSNGYVKIGFDAAIGLDGQKLAYNLPIQLEYWF